MRDIKVIKKKRDELRSDRAKAGKKISEIMERYKRPELSLLGNERAELNYLYSVHGKLTLQISTLDYVLNEDSELLDTLAPSNDLVSKEFISGVFGENRVLEVVLKSTHRDDL